ncbi:segregation and condensation protein B [Antricoccus suffuscus]|uniref:Segregation and condensation protein B n=1 Tax=Antricoccus suffuscus TaxID=1629062 RepID=A0A2T0ZXX0_9ACTN|nr:SMC-Scp complex subunit ScpB [Antricoccus suffuscus]PRZ40928.1 segregation and condensation protein B [Antricoccus suffuscus]
MSETPAQPTDAAEPETPIEATKPNDAAEAETPIDPEAPVEPTQPEPLLESTEPKPVEIEETVVADEPDIRLLESDISPAIESILLVVDTPTPAVDIARAVGISTEEAEQHLTEIAADYEEQGRGFQLRQAAGGWRLYTREEYAPYVEKYVLDGQKTRLTQAALETLAVIAYRQPVTRSRVSAIRGVNVDGVVRTLLTRELIEESGTDEQTGGGQLSTTDLFLEKLGLRSLEDLPPIAPHLPDVAPEMDERLESGLAQLASLDSED